MSSDVALQAMFDRFLEHFVLPLVASGEVLVSYPLGVGAIDYFKVAEPVEPEHKGELSRARQRVLERIVPMPLPLELAPDEIELLAALHNVLLSNHQELVAGFRGVSRWKHCLSWARESVTEIPYCGSPQEALERHSLLHQVYDLSRIDVVVRSRRTTRRYLGQEPPARAMIWPNFRRIHRSEEVVGLADLVATDDARGVMTEIMERSPLTCLLAMPYARHPEVHLGEFSWSPSVVMVLSRPDLCRAVTYRHLDLGLATVGPHLSWGVLAELDRVASGAASSDHARLSFALRYILNLQLTHCWTTEPEEQEKSVGQSWDGAFEELRRLFFGWFAVALAREDRAGAPPSPNEELRSREEAYRRAAAHMARPVLEDAARQVDLLVRPERFAAIGEPS